MVVMFSSCAKYPQAEVDAAKAAVETARAAGADVYLPEAFAGLLDSLNATTVLVEEEKSKFFSNYDAAIAKLTAISAASTQMVADTETRKAELKEEALVTIEAVKVLVADNHALVAKAPKGKEGKAALEAIKADLAVVEGSITEASALVESGNFIGAVDKAKAANEKAVAINEELNAAIAKKGRK